MGEGIFAQETSITLTKQPRRIEFVAADGAVQELKSSFALLEEVLDGTHGRQALETFLRGKFSVQAEDSFSLHMKATMMKVSIDHLRCLCQVFFQSLISEHASVNLNLFQWLGDLMARWIICLMRA